MLICALEVRRSVSVLTGIETESAFMGNLRGRRREMVDMTETNLGDIVQDFHWMMRTDLHLSQCQQKQKLPLGGGSHITHRLCSTLCYWIVLLQAKSRKKSSIFGEHQCAAIQLYLWIILSIVILRFSLLRRIKVEATFCKVKTTSSFLLQISWCSFTRCIYTQRSFLPLSNHHVYHTLQMHRMKQYNYTTQ